MPGSRVVVAIVGAPHGVRGEVRLKTFTEDPLGIATYGEVETADGRSLTVKTARALKGDMIVARFDGLNTREAVEALTGIELTVPRERLPAPEEDEFYLADLIGLEALTETGEKVGRVVAVPNFGAGDLLEIAADARRDTLLVPFTKAFVPVIDMAGGHVVVHLPEELLDDTPP